MFLVLLMSNLMTCGLFFLATAVFLLSLIIVLQRTRQAFGQGNAIRTT